jgi:CheY-like chemotaxis protein
LNHTFTSTINGGFYPFNTCRTDAYIPEVDMSKDSSKKILIVEDEAILAMCLQDKLVDLGYGIHAAVGSGEQAVQAALDHRPDLVLMDIKLSGRMDGLEAARQIRELFDIPVIFMSAYSDVDTLQRALLTGSAGYLIKPVQLESLGRVIERALNEQDVKAPVN